MRYNLEKKNSAGHDGISNKLSKIVTSVVIVHLAKLIRACKFFPVCLKIAKIIPLHKDGNCEEMQKILTTEFGFRSNHLCAHAITSVKEMMQSVIDSQKIGFARFTDYKKA